ncbi:EF-hand domain-containing protein [Sphingobium sp. CR28]|uniref:EF-hand domain-containing protein n=1 Tax=Sphingobium sp. CR28 TaxID=3400272 RepID=UPI003FEE052F
MFISAPVARDLIVGSIAFAVSLSTQAGAQTAPQGRDAITRADIQKRLEARFDALDTNKDGVISADERKANSEKSRARMFARIDKDGNGSISREEFSAQRRGPARRGMGGQAMTGRSANASMSKADFVNRRLAMFDRVDTNHDGIISPEERGAVRGKMRQHRGAGAPPAPASGG